MRDLFESPTYPALSSPLLGHRFKTTYDFGFVALDLLYSYPEDSGTYMCKATNLVGEAVTTCNVGVEGRSVGQWATIPSGLGLVGERVGLGVMWSLNSDGTIIGIL